MRAWVRRHARGCLLVLGLMALAGRGLLALEAPRPWGYVWDRYHPPIQLLHAQGALPESRACWQCYHPPFFYMAGLPLYALGIELAGGESTPESRVAGVRLATLLSLLSVGLVVYSCARLLRHYRFGVEYRVLGIALVLVLPCLFVASWGLEADIVLTALMSAFIVELVRYANTDGGRSLARLLRMALLCGLSIATKYNGLVSGVVATITIVAKQRRAGRPRRILRDGAVLAVVALGLGGWKYADNLVKYGTPLFANGTALEGFSLEREVEWDRYDFLSLDLVSAIEVMATDAPDGKLTDQPAYRAVWPTLHTLVWSDMSLFSRPGRHGSGGTMYPAKRIPLWLPATVVVLGLVPAALGLVGMVVTWRRRSVLPLHLLTAVTAVVYAQWFLAQSEWALKPKYVLFLLPAGLVYVLFGLRFVDRRAPPFAAATLWAVLAALVGTAQVYDLWFALA